MKQKVVIRVTICMCNPVKSRTKAMKIAATVSGVESIAIKGVEKDEIEVVGEGVDTVELTKSLRKNVGHAVVVSVGPVKEEKKEEKKEENKGEKKEEKKEEKVPVVCYPYYWTNTPYYQVYEVRDSCQSGCFIL